MTGEAHLAMTMGALMFAGGAMGYRKGSVPSLVAGCCFGTGYLIAGWLVKEKDPQMGHLLGFGLSSALAAGMGIRAAKSGKPVPLAVAGLGGASAAYFGLKAKEWA